MARASNQQVRQTLLKVLACGASVESAARKAGVSERSVYRRLAEAEFRKELSRARAEIVERTVSMLTGGGLGAVKALVDIQQDVSVSPAVRLRAARDILELGLKYREAAELEQRLTDLEERALNPGPRLLDPNVA